MVKLKNRVSQPISIILIEISVIISLKKSKQISSSLN